MGGMRSSASRSVSLSSGCIYGLFLSWKPAEMRGHKQPTNDRSYRASHRLERRSKLHTNELLGSESHDARRVIAAVHLPKNQRSFDQGRETVGENFACGRRRARAFRKVAVLVALRSLKAAAA